MFSVLFPVVAWVNDCAIEPTTKLERSGLSRESKPLGKRQRYDEFKKKSTHMTGTFDQCASEITSGNALTFFTRFTEVFWRFDHTSFI